MIDTKDNATPSRWPHRWAIVTACATLPLMLIGAEVTSKGVGMVDPQGFRSPWHLFTLSMDKIGLGYLIEHSHRLLGFIAGTCTIILTVLTLKLEPRRWVKTLSLLVLIGICIQGMLGAFRVQLNAILGHELKLIHGIFAQVVFSLMVSVIIVTSRRWQQTSLESPAEQSTLRRWSLLVIGAIFVQIILGGLTRHYGYPWAPRLHLFGAMFVIVVLVWFIHLLVVAKVFERPLSSAIKLLGALLTLQVVLGLEAWLTKFQTITNMGVPLQPMITPSAVANEATFGNLVTAILTRPDLFRSLHFITGSLILATVVSISLYLYRGMFSSKESITESHKQWEGAA